MRELYKSGVRAEILFYLRDYGDTKRSSLVSVFAKYNARHVQRVVAKMIEDGELDEYKKPPEPSKTPVRYVRLTDLSTQRINDIEKQYGKQENVVKTNISRIKKKNRKEAVLQVYSTCGAMGCGVTEADKLPIQRLIGNQKTPTKGLETKIIQKMERDGAFYSMTEIRDACKEQLGYGPLNATRCVGIIIRRRKVQFVYNIGGKLIYFNQILEERTRDVILESLERSEISRECIDFDQTGKASCIIFGTNYAVIAKLFYERKKGALNLDANGNPKEVKGKWEPNRDKLTVKNLASLYSEAYFVSLKNTRVDFDTASRMTPEITRDIESKWISSQSALREARDSSGAQAVIKGSGAKVFLWFDNNLYTLYHVFESQEKVYVVIPESGTEQVIARVLGTRLIKIQTIAGEVLNVKRYDDTGHLIKEAQP